MSQKISYSKSVTLQGMSSALTVTVIIDDVAQWVYYVKNAVDLDYAFNLHFDVILEYNDEGITIKQERKFSAYSESLFNLLDVSICMAHCADREDTTEMLEGVGFAPLRHHKTLWAMFEEFLDAEIFLASQNVRGFDDQRSLYFYFYPDEANPFDAKPGLVVTTPDRLLIFAEQLRQIYDVIENLQTAGEPPN